MHLASGKTRSWFSSWPYLIELPLQTFHSNVGGSDLAHAPFPQQNILAGPPLLQPFKVLTRLLMEEAAVLCTGGEDI